MEIVVEMMDKKKGNTFISHHIDLKSQSTKKTIKKKKIRVHTLKIYVMVYLINLKVS